MQKTDVTIETATKGNTNNGEINHEDTGYHKQVDVICGFECFGFIYTRDLYIFEKLWGIDLSQIFGKTHTVDIFISYL